MGRELFQSDGLAEAALRIRRLEIRVAQLEEHVLGIKAALARDELTREALALRALADPAGQEGT